MSSLSSVSSCLPPAAPSSTPVADVLIGAWGNLAWDGEELSTVPALRLREFLLRSRVEMEETWPSFRDTMVRDTAGRPDVRSALSHLAGRLINLTEHWESACELIRAFEGVPIDLSCIVWSDSSLWLGSQCRALELLRDSGNLRLRSWLLRQGFPSQSERVHQVLGRDVRVVELLAKFARGWRPGAAYWKLDRLQEAHRLTTVHPDFARVWCREAAKNLSDGCGPGLPVLPLHDLIAIYAAPEGACPFWVD